MMAMLTCRAEAIVCCCRYFSFQRELLNCNLQNNNSIRKGDRGVFETCCRDPCRHFRTVRGAWSTLGRHLTLQVSTSNTTPVYLRDSVYPLTFLSSFTTIFFFLYSFVHLPFLRFSFIFYKMH
jgi:hypothetical protein